MIQNGEEATIFSMYSPYVISGNDITSYRRTQNTWTKFVEFINYCSTLHGQKPLYDTTKYIDQDKADELIDKFEKTI